ncbi:MAG: type II toxin-antitoxin system Phd/YefM family antitoxin [Chloroflexi bacterium]|nr:type II toxin-antitoxin system Phd/YefM family antitoxin [Chloroflexota bacterium]
MVTVNVHEAKTQLSRLLAQVEAGEEVTIARNGAPVARLVAYKPRGKREFGAMKGDKFWEEMGDLILEPLPEEELRLWEGG